MLKFFVLACCVFVFSGKITAQPSGKIKQHTIKSFKYSDAWASCHTKTLFSSHYIYYRFSKLKTVCHNNWGIGSYSIHHLQPSEFKNKSTFIKTSVSFSFENFASCLVFLNFKKFKLAPIQKAFNKFKSKYVQKKGLISVAPIDYYRFQKCYKDYIKNLDTQQKEILKGYIDFFESRSK